MPPWPAEHRRKDLITEEMSAAMHGLLDGDGAPPSHGELLPPLWHWLAFLPRVRQQDLGDDGHPTRAAFLPQVDLPRRMFLGGRLSFPRALLVGHDLYRDSAVLSVEEKHGSSGPMVLLTVRHNLMRASSRGVSDAVVEDAAVEDAVVEEQDIGYLQAERTGPALTRPSRSPPDEPDPSSSEWEWSSDLAVDPTLLFRFSALTYNAHRIHYDRTYATEVERYPGLVVHGPLQAMALAELLRRHAPAVALTSFTFRAVRAAFDLAPLQLRARPVSADTVSLIAFDHLSRPTVRAVATTRSKAVD